MSISTSIQTAFEKVKAHKLVSCAVLGVVAVATVVAYKKFTAKDTKDSKKKMPHSGKRGKSNDGYQLAASNSEQPLVDNQVSKVHRGLSDKNDAIGNLAQSRVAKSIRDIK